MRDEKCETCRWRGDFYKPADQDVTKGGETYKCRRHAPVVTGGLHSQTMTVWPWVRKFDFCGEHSPKDFPHD